MMPSKDFRIVYMGTPEFAVEPLKVLLDRGFNVVAVVTAADKPAGRGQKLAFSPVKEFALGRSLPVLQPEKLKDPAFLSQLGALKPDLNVVVAFRMLPKLVWAMPPRGTINLHASLLPQYRGAAPINWAVINGEPETGVTTFFIEEEIDTGKIIKQERLPILPTDNVGDVYANLMALGSRVLADTVELISLGKETAVDQGEILKPGLVIKPAPKISKEDCRIDWAKRSEDVHNLVRGFSPYPAAWTNLVSENHEPLLLKIFSSALELNDHDEQPGSIVTDSKSRLKVATCDGFINILELQPAGKKRMDVVSFLNGHHISTGDRVQ